MIAILRDAWPEKLEATGEKSLRELAGLTDEEAAQAGLHGADGRCLMATLGLCFGSGVLHDPLYPWLHKRLFADVLESERVEETRKALAVYALQAVPGARGHTYGR
jgi:hypothetical protein